ncbi:uncharacterized protein LOC111017496 isoform X2 [Momordica charantia]|uniref:Uncharacterized protein LOC111017496 isoform X2 n=1 Tax=Momordica charantia TaxID=3673 RepID=A0A6J1D5L1_MOMCH|nr:uncharacterized protein LOC111017496 isoform X2 [Momordica charantia]
MAFRRTLWKSMLVGIPSRIEGKRCFASSTTASSSSSSKSEYMKGEYAPIYIVMGMVVVAVTIGTHTAKQQLLHSPVVMLSKKKRESIPEVDDPDTVITSADKFVNKSFLRKVAHIQDHNKTLRDPQHPDPFTRPRNAETLKTAGVDPTHSR